MGGNAPLGFLALYVIVGIVFTIGSVNCFNWHHYRDRMQHHPGQPDLLSEVWTTIFWPGYLLGDIVDTAGIFNCTRHP
ncbi:MAG: hypothetical protein ABIS18_08375 [Actinomycetota bacterium]